MSRPDLISIAISGAVGFVGAALTLGAGVAFGTLNGGIAGGLVAAGLGAAGAWFVDARTARSPTPPLERNGRAKAGIVVSGADLSKGGGPADRRAGAGDLADSAEEVRESLREVAGIAELLGDSSRHMADGAADQAATVTRATNTVEALSDRIDRISQNAEDAAKATEGTRQQAMQGQEQIREIVEGMDQLRSVVQANARKARRLGERSVEIGAIVRLIDEVSSRTDMLALNATIESVRAGEHGRGFAVVAEEIRKLAERAAGATQEIGTLVEAIQADTHESIRALADEEAQMEEETRRVREAGSALERIGRMAEDSARLVDGISHSANDQVLATRDLVAGMQRISGVARLILVESRQIRQHSGDLAARCDRLRARAGSGATEENRGGPPCTARRLLPVEVNP